MICIDDSKIVTELDGEYLADWNQFAIYMNYGDIYKTRTGECYFYKGLHAIRAALRKKLILIVG